MAELYGLSGVFCVGRLVGEEQDCNKKQVWRWENSTLLKFLNGFWPQFFCAIERSDARFLISLFHKRNAR